MKGNTDLFDLVKSLSKTEKRLFAMYCALQKGEKHYEFLFHAIAGQKNYNENEFKKSLRGHAVTQHWSVNKKYLYDKIVASLRQSGSNNDADAEISSLLDSYKVLRKKGLTNQAMRFLRKAKKKAKDYDLFTRLYSILNQQYLDTLNSSRHAADKALEGIIQERKEVLKIIENYSFIGDIYSRQKMWLRLHGNIKSKTDKNHIQQIIEPLKRIKPENLLSDTARSLYNVAWADFYQAIHRPAKALHFLRQNIELNSVQRHKKAEVDISELSTYLFLAIKNKFLDDVEKPLDRFYAYVDEKFYQSASWVYERWFFFTIASFYVRGDFSSARSFLLRESDRFKKNEDNMSRWNKLNNYYAIAYTWFGSGKPEQAMPWVQKIVQTNEVKIETYTFARILQLIILYERGYFDLLEHQLRSFDLHLKSRKREYLKSLNLSGLLRSLIPATTFEGHKLFHQYQQRLARFKNDATFLEFEFYFDLTGWVESKLTKTAFDNTLQKRYRKLYSG